MTGRVPIPWATPILWGHEESFVLDALKSTWISGGRYVSRFEEELAAFLQVRHACAVANGTVALHAAYLGIGVERGNEIVVPGFAFMAAANIALHMGAIPVFAEVDADTWCVTAEAIERRISARTRVIVVVHTYGNVCDMDDILALARDRGVPVIEDAAEAFASRYHERFAGALATVGTYSFHATKTITTGEGGMVVTGDPAIHERVALFHSHGLRRKRHYWHEIPGHNFRLTNLQAALGCAQFERLDAIVRERKRIHRTYAAALKDVAGVRLQVFRPEVDPVLWALALELDPAAYPQGRDRVIEQLASEGIETRNGFYAASQLPIYPDCGPLPVCERLAKNVISLPTFPSLDEQQISYVSSSLAALRK
ncbi:MAG: hypothetical protein A3G24_19510 [Betaproteobacteria bacterium RIFCSPLOWO2_12_FULL_62_13]|nr:MAG: hypothetical protein A3G24_19510 [Betaproteobacteria bacterium RIFCSPLOWO2_12_FULL_62_13]